MYRWWFAWVLVLVLGCAKYDKLVEANITCDEKWANIEAQLQRRYDLIPNIVATVKAAAKFESDTLTKLTEARASAGQIKLTSEDLTDPVKFEKFQRAQDQLSSSLSRLLVVRENYPELKSNQSFQTLMVELEGTENRILRAREEYNAAVKTYNSELGKVGGQVVNKVTGKPFAPRVFFTASSEAKTTAPKVDL
jgi:LemA protein